MQYVVGEDMVMWVGGRMEKRKGGVFRRASSRKEWWRKKGKMEEGKTKREGREDGVAVAVAASTKTAAAGLGGGGVPLVLEISRIGEEKNG
ncbi:uncharacterized protein G2W53_014747 [Senna tora]|uniref:Uncharacterized protein n=1 Tax=Senna tora TaxID=362788 RepID=A0A834WU99_9FABA|nr:uncharacterized protein G2W53_014747 [Senna tora]